MDCARKIAFYHNGLQFSNCLLFLIKKNYKNVTNPKLKFNIVFIKHFVVNNKKVTKYRVGPVGPHSNFFKK